MAAVFAPAEAVWSRGHRAIAGAVTASLALHVLALFVLPQFKPRPLRSDPAPLVARLVQVRPAPELRAPVAPVAPEPQVIPVPPPEPAQVASRPPRKPPARVARARDLPAQQPVAERPHAPALAPEPAPVASAPAPASTSAPAPDASPAAATVALAQTAPAARAQVPVPPGVETAEASALGKYRVAIISAARRYRRYPRVAIDNGWEGRADVRLSIDAGGEQSSIGIERASGHAILDEAALDMIGRARRLAAIPPALRGRPFTIDLPVLFNLKDELR